MILDKAQPATEENLAEVLGIDVIRHWTQDALCAQTDPEIFFPEKGGSVREAVRVCSECPVQQVCLDAALAEESADFSYGRFGVRGGTTPRERVRIAAGAVSTPLQTMPPEEPNRMAA